MNQRLRLSEEILLKLLEDRESIQLLIQYEVDLMGTLADTAVAYADRLIEATKEPRNDTNQADTRE